MFHQILVIFQEEEYSHVKRRYAQDIYYPKDIGKIRNLFMFIHMRGTQS